MDLREDSFAEGLRHTFQNVVEYLSEGLQIVSTTYQEKMNPSFGFSKNEGFDVMRATMGRSGPAQGNNYSGNDALDAIFPGTGNSSSQSYEPSQPAAAAYAQAPVAHASLPKVDFGFGSMVAPPNPVPHQAEQSQAVPVAQAAPSAVATQVAPAAAAVAPAENTPQQFSEHLMSRHTHNKAAMKSALEASMALQQQLMEDQAARDKMQADFIRAARSPLASWRRAGATRENVRDTREPLGREKIGMSNPMYATRNNPRTNPAPEPQQSVRPARAENQYDQPVAPGWVQSSSPYRTRHRRQQQQQAQPVQPKAPQRVEISPEEQSMRMLFDSYQHLNRSMDKLLYSYFHTGQD